MRMRCLRSLSIARLTMSAALVGSATLHAQRPASVPPPVRRSFATVGGTLTLGEPLGWASRYLLPTLQNIALVPGDSAVGVRDIKMSQTSAGRITRLSITLDTTASLTALINEQRALLGSPTDSLVRYTLGARGITYIWRDERTIYTISRFVPALRGGVGGLAELRDRDSDRVDSPSGSLTPVAADKVADQQ